MANSAINLSANVFGLAVQMASGLAFSIVFFQILGPAGFGLVNFCALLLSLCANLADFGIGRTVTREIARSKNVDGERERLQDILFTFQVSHIILGILVGFALYYSSSIVSNKWLSTDELTNHDSEKVIALVGLLAAIVLPMITTSAALNGLERHIERNIIVAFFSVCQGAGVLASLLIFGANPTVYIVAQCAVAFLQLLVQSVVVWFCISKKELLYPRFKYKILRDNGTFAINDGVSAIIGLLVLHGDRIILSSILSLDLFGGYALAVTLSSVIYNLPSPLNTTFYPRFVVLYSTGNYDGLRQIFWRATRFLQSMLAPALLVMVFFSHSLLVIVGSSHINMLATFSLVLSFRSLGTGIHAIIQLPYSLLLSAGRSDLGLKANIITAIVYPPLLYILVDRFGVMAAPVLWFIVMAVTFFPIVNWAHQFAQIGPMRMWLQRVIAPPLILSALVIAPLALLMPDTLSPSLRLIYISASGFIATLIGIVAIEDVRRTALRNGRDLLCWATVQYHRKKGV